MLRVSSNYLSPFVCLLPKPIYALIPALILPSSPYFGQQRCQRLRRHTAAFWTAAPTPPPRAHHCRQSHICSSPISAPDGRTKRKAINRTRSSNLERVREEEERRRELRRSMSEKRAEEEMSSEEFRICSSPISAPDCRTERLDQCESGAGAGGGGEAPRIEAEHEREKSGGGDEQRRVPEEDGGVQNISSPLCILCAHAEWGKEGKKLIV